MSRECVHRVFSGNRAPKLEKQRKMRPDGTGGVTITSFGWSVGGPGLYGAFANFRGVNTLTMVQFQVTNLKSSKEDVGRATHSQFSP